MRALSNSRQKVDFFDLNEVRKRAKPRRERSPPAPIRPTVASIRNDHHKGCSLSPSANSAGNPFAGLPTIFTVLGKLGLELKRQEDILPVYTVERIERPAAN